MVTGLLPGRSSSIWGRVIRLTRLTRFGSEFRMGSSFLSVPPTFVNDEDSRTKKLFVAKISAERGKQFSEGANTQAPVAGVKRGVIM